MTGLTPQLWWACLSDFSGLFEELSAELPSEERERADRFRVGDARRRFVLARTVLRRQLGAALGAEPHTLAFTTGDHGKPHLVSSGVAAGPQFNLSHSGDLVVLAISPVDVGVDVERLREVANAERLARRFFSPAEQGTVCGLRGHDRDHAFLRIWTQKEAYLKATGLGVGMALREIETEPDQAAPPALRAIAGDPVEAAHWTLLEAQVPEAVCTVAVRGSVAEPQVLRFTPADLKAL